MAKVKIILTVCVEGTWNSDPNHIDYIPTRGMNKEDEMSDAALNDDSLDMSLMDSESTLNHTAGSPVTATSIETSSPSPVTTHSRLPNLNSNLPSQLPYSHKPRKAPRKRAFPHKWSSSPKLTSSRFCEHRGMTFKDDPT